MKVLTLKDHDFQTACRQLRQRFEGHSGVPAITIGIERGGLYVARFFCGPEPLVSIRCQRKTTRLKSGIAVLLIRSLPRPVSDLLRISESRLLGIFSRLAIHRSESAKDTMCDEEWPEETIEALGRLSPGELVAVVDDAADSGQTLRKVCHALRSRFPKLHFATAVITATRREGADTADVALFRNNTLVRFPWSADAGSMDRYNR